MYCICLCTCWWPHPDPHPYLNLPWPFLHTSTLYIFPNNSYFNRNLPHHLGVALSLMTLLSMHSPPICTPISVSPTHFTPYPFAQCYADICKVGWTVWVKQASHFRKKMETCKIIVTHLSAQVEIGNKFIVHLFGFSLTQTQSCSSSAGPQVLKFCSAFSFSSHCLCIPSATAYRQFSITIPHCKVYIWSLLCIQQCANFFHTLSCQCSIIWSHFIPFQRKQSKLPCIVPM